MAMRPKTAKAGQFGSASGLMIINIAATIATPATTIGKAFGPRGSAKNGCSN